ncbi:glycosyltransferase [Aquimarina sp. AD10]|uniref:glycosyltransferase n=1 Tax=Aquimarina sp. AD10 TaxID=1714849 RepID=UPI000E4F2F58|nr:glycosyltransferase [Aquimarina sp. AD10]AXT62678.1 glycosyltransferase [Aquimarina sp. AD10]RKM98327.1 glycosyltransferase [Aquimarina sp. AD10]
MKTGIIISCYNEEKRLNTTLFLNFINREDKFHLCFVNNGSKDDTISLLKTIQMDNPLKVSVVDIKKNCGKAEAVRAGARYLHSRGDITFVGFIDASLSTTVKDADELLKSLKTNYRLGMVFGSRTKKSLKEFKKMYESIISANDTNI